MYRINTGSKKWYQLFSNLEVTFQIPQTNNLKSKLMETKQEITGLEQHLDMAVDYLSRTCTLKGIIHLRENLQRLDLPSHDISYYRGIAHSLELHLKTVIELKNILVKAGEKISVREVA